MQRVLILLLTAFLIATDIARAQSGRSAAAWVDALSEFTAAIAGTYGDEGPRITAALDKMAASPRPTDPAGAAVLQNWQLSSRDPIAAYHVFRQAAKNGDAQEMQRARESLTAAYRTLLQDKSRTKASPFADLSVVRADASDSPVLPPVAYASGYDLIARGAYTNAIAVFRKAAETDPLVTDPALRSPAVMQSIAAARQRRLADARSQLEGAAALRDSSEAHRLLGMLYWVNGQDDQGIEQLEIAIRLNPRDERARLAFARMLSSFGRDADAERTLQDTIRVWPDSALAHWWLGSIYDRTNRLADARREFALAAPSAVAGRAQFFTKIGQLATTVADIPAAVDAFARSVEENPNDAEAHRRLAGALLLQDLNDEVFVELVAVLLIDPRDAGAYAGIGRIHLNAGRYDDALPALRRAIELSPDYAEARYALATTLMRMGKTEEAEREFQRVQQSQRRELDDRRRKMFLEVQEEENKAKGVGR